MAAYPQAPPMADEMVAAFLETAPIARLGSHNADGTIHLTPTWFLFDEGEILIGTQLISRKARNVAADGRVTLVVDNQEPPYKGVIVYGTATLDREDAATKRMSIFAKYMSPEKAEKGARDMARTFEPVIIRIRPKRIVSYDYAA